MHVTDKENHSIKQSLDIPTRLRRLRANTTLRSLVKETTLTKKDFVVPLFLVEGKKQKIPIRAMPNIFRYSIDVAIHIIGTYLKKGLHTFALFPAVSPEKKCCYGKEALRWDSLIPKALRELKKTFPEACFIADIALDPFTSHGHDGIMNEKKEILNDVTVHILGKMACIYAESGADIVAPSDMMDGRVGHIRDCLDKKQLHNVCILSYSAKYASCFYAPFRDAIGSCLQVGDKKSYQLDYANKKEAVLEAVLDEKEHADILLVKPAGFYLDVIQEIKQRCSRPVAAYHVSGEYAMIMAAEQKGLLDAKQAFLEVLTSIKRAGADIIFSYAIDHILSDLP